MGKRKKSKTSEKIKMFVVLSIFVLFVIGAVYLIRASEQARYEQILKDGIATKATITNKYDVPKFKSGTDYIFILMFTANKNTSQLDTVDFGMDIKIPWTTTDFDFDLISTSIKVGSKTYAQYKEGDKVDIVYLKNNPEEEVVMLKK